MPGFEEYGAFKTFCRERFKSAYTCTFMQSISLDKVLCFLAE